MNKFFLLASVLSFGFVCNANAALSNNSLIICRGQQCADAKYTMTKEYMFNQIADLFEKNITKEILLCEADPASHRCIEPGIRLDGQTNHVKADISIPSAEILDTKLVKGQTALDTILDFSVKANGTRPRCQSALTQLRVLSIDDVQMSMGGFDCSFTETGNSTINMSYKIDMIDFDYGTIGAYYTVGAGQVMRGGKNGYTLMRFTEKMPGTVYMLSDKNDPQAQEGIRKQLAGSTEVITETQTSVEVKESAAAGKPAIGKTDTTVVSDTKTTVVKAQCAHAKTVKQSGSKTVVGDIECAEETQAIVQKKTVADADQIVAQETVTVTTTQQEGKFWDRFWDKTQKVIYLEESLW